MKRSKALPPFTSLNFSPVPRARTCALTPRSRQRRGLFIMASLCDGHGCVWVEKSLVERQRGRVSVVPGMKQSPGTPRKAEVKLPPLTRVSQAQFSRQSICIEDSQISQISQINLITAKRLGAQEQHCHATSMGSTCLSTAHLTQYSPGAPLPRIVFMSRGTTHPCQL